MNSKSEGFNAYAPSVVPLQVMDGLPWLEAANNANNDSGRTISNEEGLHIKLIPEGKIYLQSTLTKFQSQRAPF